MVWSWATEYGDPSRKPATPRRADSGGGNPLVQRVMALQATAGNAAVRQLVQQQGQQGPQGGQGTKPAKPEILRYGSTGDDVKRLQERLNAFGRAGAPLKVDGIYGPLTTAAVRKFQETHRPLEVDGTVGPEVWAELERVGDEGSPMPGVDAGAFFDKGRALYAKGLYALAFDEFAKAHELDADPAYIFNMAQALRLVGGRREDAIKLYEQFIAAGPNEAGIDVAKSRIAELRGPGPSGDRAKDAANVDELFKKGKELYADDKWGPAYDEFTKAYEIGHDPHLLWDRAVSLRLMGGRRAQTIALYEQLLTVDIPDDKKAAAKLELDELRGPRPSGDQKKDLDAQDVIFKQAQADYEGEHYAQAYDGFSKAWELTHAPEMIWNRAQALRLLGGRREEAIKLYQQVLALDVPEDTKKAARVYINELKGPGKAITGAADNR